MNISAANRSVLTSMHRVLEQLCGGDWAAVRVACVPNGIEYRFLATVEVRRRPDVYGFLAEHTDMPIPIDGGPLNLSQDQAVELGQIDPAKAREDSPSPRGKRASKQRRAESETAAH
jgi:hypothetical protein